MPAGEYYLRAKFLDQFDLINDLESYNPLLATSLLNFDEDDCEFLDIMYLNTDFERHYIAQLIAKLNKMNEDIFQNQQKLCQCIHHYSFYLFIDYELFRIKLSTKLKLHNNINDFSDLTIDGEILWIPDEKRSSQLLKYFQNPSETSDDELIKMTFTRTNIGLVSVDKFQAPNPYDLYLWEVFHGVILTLLKPAAIGLSVEVSSELLDRNGYQTQQKAYAERECDHMKIFSIAHIKTGVYFQYILTTPKLASLKEQHELICEKSRKIKETPSNGCRIS